MFETEADFAETKMLINCNGDYSKKQNYKKGWQDGAEFGYNKAKEELEEFIMSHRKERDYVFDAWHKQIEYAKTIIQDLLSNSDEYARQRAIDFLKESE